MPVASNAAVSGNWRSMACSACASCLLAMEYCSVWQRRRMDSTESDMCCRSAPHAGVDNSDKLCKAHHSSTAQSVRNVTAADRAPVCSLSVAAYLLCYHSHLGQLHHVMSALQQRHTVCSCLLHLLCAEQAEQCRAHLEQLQPVNGHAAEQLHALLYGSFVCRRQECCACFLCRLQRMQSRVCERRDGSTKRHDRFGSNGMLAVQEREAERTRALRLSPSGIRCTRLMAGEIC